MGIPVVLVYLGFTGDKEIAADYFASHEHWVDTIESHIEPHFPLSSVGKDIDCGRASFTLMLESREVLSQSPPIEERRRAVLGLVPECGGSGCLFGTALGGLATLR